MEILYLLITLQTFTLKHYYISVEEVTQPLWLQSQFSNYVILTVNAKTR